MDKFSSWTGQQIERREYVLSYGYLVAEKEDSGNKGGHYRWVYFDSMQKVPTYNQKKGKAYRRKKDR